MKPINQFLETIFDRPFRNLEDRVLQNALNLNIFEDLNDAISSDALAEKRQWHKQNSAIFLQTLAALGYLERSGDSYQNSENTRRYLVKNSPHYIGTFVLIFNGYISANFPEDFTALLENGPQPPTQNADVDYSQMIAMLRAYQSAYPQAQFRELLGEYSEYKAAKKILDLGCGTAMIGLGFAKDNSAAEIVLYDLPAMENAIKESVAMANVANKTTVMTGDYTTDDIGAGYDVVFSANSIYSAKMALKPTLQKIYDSLNDNGIFVCVSDGVAKDYSAPWDMVVSWLPFRMNNMDMSVTKDMVLEAALAVGFKPVKKEHLHLIGGRVDVDVLKK